MYKPFWKIEHALFRKPCCINLGQFDQSEARLKSDDVMAHNLSYTFVVINKEMAKTWTMDKVEHLLHLYDKESDLCGINHPPIIPWRTLEPNIWKKIKKINSLVVFKILYTQINVNNKIKCDTQPIFLHVKFTWRKIRCVISNICTCKMKEYNIPRVLYPK